MSHNHEPEPHHEEKPDFTIFIDAVKYVVHTTSMTGADLKALAHIDAGYQLFEEERGDHPDKPIADNSSVAIRPDLHFYAIPPTHQVRDPRGRDHGDPRRASGAARADGGPPVVGDPDPRSQRHHAGSAA